MSVLVIGATGTIGGPLLQALLQRGITAVGTSRSPAETDPAHPKNLLKVDLGEPDSLHEAMSGIKRVFLYVEGIRDPAAIAAVLSARDCEQVVLLSTYAIELPGATNDYNAQRHLLVENALTASGLPTTFLRPEGFATNTLGWATSIRGEAVARMPYPDAHLAPIHEMDVVEVALAALTGDDLIDSAPILTGPQSLTQRQQVEIIADATGRKLEVQELTRQQAYDHMTQTWPGPLADGILDLWAYQTGAPAAVTNSVQQVTGHPARTFASWVHDHIDAFRLTSSGR